MDTTDSPLFVFYIRDTVNSVIDKISHFPLILESLEPKLWLLSNMCVVMNVASSFRVVTGS